MLINFWFTVGHGGLAVNHGGYGVRATGLNSKPSHIQNIWTLFTSDIPKKCIMTEGPSFPFILA